MSCWAAAQLLTPGPRIRPTSAGPPPGSGPVRVGVREAPPILFSWGELCAGGDARTGECGGGGAGAGAGLGGALTGDASGGGGAGAPAPTGAASARGETPAGCTGGESSWRPILSLPLACFSVLIVLPCLMSNTCSMYCPLYGTSLARLRMTSPRKFEWFLALESESSHSVHSSWLVCGSLTGSTNCWFHSGEMDALAGVVLNACSPRPPTLMRSCASTVGFSPE
mmetsp:Transcript_53484/g.130672  ORF Transcript_53484/g.130672 Transcript_53484/m.130672 type:complete len:225 (-) Transcript_53484:121-795(-)